ncbi:uncharacterized protein LOC119727780 isoform X2 [Patiria miniata]|uniref:Tower domain-containing protein n=1 Tax=Patiria miniata TaxID=46514 RepID=A0A913ZWT7_PATMI|nr:uncharacterized protein LOC119727780 isoform X2 [Patiria miniata]
MKSATVEGRFSRQHCSNKSHKCHAGQTKPTLLFKGSKKPSGLEPKHCCFSALLQEKDVDLGPVDQNWFEKAIGAKELPVKECQENSVCESNPPKLVGEITETPARHRCRNDQQAVTPQLLLSPCLFTPDERRSVSQQTRKQQDDGQTSLSTSRHALGTDISPVTPSLIPITPNLPAEKRNPAKWTPAKLDTSPSSQGLDPTQEEPSLGGWFPVHKQTTPTFMKQLFKTPSTVSKLEDISFATPGQFLSTPLRMSVSLGADLDDSNLSWTSSLATPQGSTKKTNTLTASNVDGELESTVIAKALFTSAMKTPEEGFRPRRLTDPDSQSSTMPLQSLHMSSAEEEEEILEDTIESDDADNGAKREDKRVVDAGDAMQQSGGRTGQNCRRLSCDISDLCTPGTKGFLAKEMEREQRLADEEIHNSEGRDMADGAPIKEGEEEVVKTREDKQDEGGEATAEQACIAHHNMQTLSTDGLTNEPRSIEVDEKGQCLSSLISNKLQDDNNQRHKLPTLIPDAILTEDNPEMVSSVELMFRSQAPKQTGESSQTDSQRSWKNLTANDLQVLEASDRSGLDRSRLEDTLAFFFLTPPQTRSRLAKFKQQNLAKDGSSVPDSSLGEKREANVESPALTSLEEHNNLQMPTRTVDELMETQDSAPTTRHTSVIIVKEEDGSLKEFVEDLSELSAGVNFTNPGVGESLSSLHPEEEKNEMCDTISENEGDNTIDACEDKVKILNVHSPENSAYPSSLSVQVAETILSPSLPVQNIAGLTPVRQARILVSPPNINSPDIFSQISPNFAEALCTITDQVSESHLAQSVLPPVPEENEQSSSNKLPSQNQSNKTSLSCKSPLLPKKDDSKPPPSDDNSNRSMQNMTVSESKGHGQQNVPKSPHEQASQLFRMQPKAATTRKFFYPSAVTALTKTNKPKAMQWVADAVLVKAEEKQQQSAPETLPEPRQETSSLGKTNNEASASIGPGSTIYSSTPAPRNSAFVTFTNFIKSERTSASGTSNPTRLTPIDTTAQAQHKLMPSFMSHQQATQARSFPADSRSNSSKTSDETTPLSRRTVAPRSNTSYCGIRRRAGAHGLPAPKRLKTTMEDDKEPKQTGEMLNSVKPSHRLPADKTILSSGNLGINASQKETLQVEASSKMTSSHFKAKDLSRSEHKLDIGVGNAKVTDTKLCATLKPNSAKQLATTQMDLSSRTSTEGIIPASVSFASASGKPINILDSALEKAKKLWSESEEERIPDSVGFTSASGKAIQVSDSALKKATALLDEADGEQSIHPTAALPAPTKDVPCVEEITNIPQSSRKGVKAPDCAPQKAVDNQREQIVSIDSASVSTGTVPDVNFTWTVVPSVASMKSNQVSESALSDAKPHSKDEHGGAFLDVDPLNEAQTGPMQELKRPAAENMKGANPVKPTFVRNDISYSSQHQDGKTEKVHGGTTNSIPDVFSDSGIQKAKTLQSEQVPSFSGFASASGKAIAIPESALQKAQKMFDDAESDIQPTVGFASAAGRPIQISESDLKKARALLDDWEETSLPTSKAQSHLQNPQGRDQDKKKISESSAVLASRNSVQQRQTKLQTTNQNLPKGFRPFKAPARVQTAATQKIPVKGITQVGRLGNPLKVEAATSDHTVPLAISPKRLQSIPESRVLEFSPEPLTETKMTVAEGMEFEEEFLSASQDQREIEAAEEMESAYAFMQAENDSFSQFEDFTINKLDPSNSIKSPGCPVGNENSVVTERKAEKSENLKSEIVADEQRVSGLSGLHSIPPSQASSQALDALDKAFVQSQSSETGDGETRGAFQADNHQAEDLIKSQHQSNSKVAVAVSENTAVNSSKSSLPVVDCPFVGFQTASGTKVTLSEEALQKAKKLLDTVADINTENGIPVEPKRTCRTSGKIVNRNTKKNSTADQIVSGFQTAGGNTLPVSRESLDHAKKLISETAEQFDQQPKNDETPPVTCSQLNVQSTAAKESKGQSAFSSHANNHMTANVTPAFSGFQTAGGRNVSISEEALKRARNLFSEEENIDSHLQTGNMQPLESICTENQEVLAGCIHRQTTDNVSVMDQPDGAVYDRGQTSKSTSSSSDVSLKRPSCVLEKSEEEARNQEFRIHTVKAGGDAQPRGFTTASGNKVAISQESLQQAKMFLEDPQEGFAAEEVTSTTPRTLGRGPLCQGFSTASGNKVSVSEAALKRAKKLWQDSDDGLGVPVVFDKESSSPDCKRRRIDREPDIATPIGFQTASGTKVSISEASLQKTKHLLDDSPECSNSAPKASAGFQTASGNKVSVSAKSLANAQRLLADAESAPEHVSRKLRKPPMGFSTASGAQVAVSGAALERARRLFQESDDNLRVSDSVADQTISKAHPHAGGDNTDAVVPDFGGRASNRRTTLSQNLKTKVAVNMSSFHQGPLAKPQMTSATKQRSWAPFPRQGSVTSRKPPTAFQPPYQTAQDQTPQSRPRPGRPQGGLQVVPETAIPLLPPKLGTPLLGDIRQDGAQPNKRALTSSKDDLQASGPAPKRARLEVGVERESVPSLDGKTTNTLSSQEQETSLPVGGWEQARRKQASRILGKKTQVFKPQPGKLFTKRLHEPRVPLWELVNGQPPQQHSSSELVDSGVLLSTLTVTSSTAEAFRFSLRDHYSPEALETSEGLVLGDGGRLVPDDAGTAGKEEFFNALLDTPGVDPKLLTSGWVNNHYRWIVWKLAAMERAYPPHLAGRLLTPNWVLLQLKYRYDREIDHAQRSALKKILERDDAPSRRMVLCVAGVHLEETSTGVMANQEGTSAKENERISSSPVPTLELTDSWYSIRTVIDKPLAGLVHAGKINVGQKLCIYGAELVGSQDACSPLEVPASLRLKISANATRRARYDARLGLQRRPQPFPLSLASLYPEGGPVGCVDVVVIRSYPMQFMEKHSEGGCTFRGRRAEEKEAARFAQEKQKRMERLYNQIHKENQEKENKKVNPSRRSSSAQKLTAKEVGKLQTGQELYEALNNAMDPGAIETLLSERQMSQLNDYQRCLHEKKQADLQGQFKRAMEDKQQENQLQRNVTPLLRLRVADYLGKPESGTDTYQLTVWRPTDDVLQLLSEGKRLKIFNLSTSAGRFCVGSSTIQLASTRATRYQIMPFPNPSATGRSFYQPRDVLRFTEAHQAGFQPAYGEVDVVGVVVTIQGAATSPGMSSSQIVYLSDAEGNFIAIKFWGGLQAHCMETLVKPGAVIATASLQWRSNSASSSIPCLHATDTTSVTQSPKAEHLRAALQHLQNQIKNPKAFSQSMEPFAVEMIHKQLRHPTPMTPRPENGPFGMSPWSDSRPTRGSATPSVTSEMGHSSFGGTVPSFNPNPNHQSFPSPAPANWTNQLRPNAASTPRLLMTPRSLVASTPGGRTPLGVVSTPVMTPNDKRKLDVSRRYDLLSRVPSPPPLSPLPTPLTNRATRSFRLPSSRRSLPRQGLSYGSNLHYTPVLKGQGSGVKCDSLRNQGHRTLESEGCAVTESVQSSEDIKSAAFTTPAKDTERHLDATCKPENSPEEDMTPSQRQIQEVLGMSYKSLGEIDLEWTQQVDPPPSPEPAITDGQSSQASPDFSYDTPSQSSTVKEEVSSAPTSKSPTGSNMIKDNDTKLVEEKPVVMSKVDKSDGRSNKPLTSKKNLGRRSRRGLVGRDTSVVTPGASSRQDSSQKQKLMSDREDQKAKGRDNQTNEQQASEETDMKGKEKPTDVEGDKNLLKDEREASKDAVEVGGKDFRQDKLALSDDTTTEQQVPPKQVSGQKKRRARSRADLSILEQSSLLGSESGEPTRRLTRSSSRRPTVEK